MTNVIVMSIHTAICVNLKFKWHLEIKLEIKEIVDVSQINVEKKIGLK